MMPDIDKVISHLENIRAWANIGKRKLYQGIEPKCCEKVSLWADEAIDMIEQQQFELLRILNKIIELGREGGKNEG